MWFSESKPHGGLDMKTWDRIEHRVNREKPLGALHKSSSQKQTHPRAEKSSIKWPNQNAEILIFRETYSFPGFRAEISCASACAGLYFNHTIVRDTCLSVV